MEVTVALCAKCDFGRVFIYIHKYIFANVLVASHTYRRTPSKVGQAVRAHADGEASTHEKTTSASTTSATSTTSTTSEPIFSTPTTGRKKVSSAVRKGFLKGSSGGFLYGDEGSREGDRGYYRNTSEGNKKPGIDQDFERLVAEADPDMSSAQASLLSTLRALSALTPASFAISLAEIK